MKDKVNSENVKKLPDINYALMAQLAYLKWNNLKKEKLIILDTQGNILSKIVDIRKILLNPDILEDIKTDFYDKPENFPSTETIDGKQGKLLPYIYHEEDKRLFLVYSLDETENRTPFFENIIDGWEYLDCATGTDIQNKLFPTEFLKEYKESGFFGVAFQRGNDIIISYRGTEIGVKDILTDINIYFKRTDIQQVEAVLFYEYIKTTYGKGKNIHITGHSLAGAIAQYVHFYAYCSNDNIFTETWNGLGAYGSILHSDEFFLYDYVATIFQKKLYSMNKDIYKDSKDRLTKFYSTSLNNLKKKRKEVMNSENLINYFMDEDFVGGWFNGDWIGKKVLVNVKSKTLNDRLYVSTGEFNRRTGEEIIETKNLEKLAAREKFHNVNNFLVFMGDSGNIMPNVIRPEFRKNALKSIVKDKVTAYSSLKVKNKEYELWKKADEEVNLYSDILSPTNRLIKPNGRIVSSTAVRQKDILFVESFEQNDFKSYDMEVKDVSGEEHIKEIKLGEYNNLEKLGGIVGGEELIIKVYKEKKKEVEETKIAQINQKANNFTRTRFEKI